MRRPESSIARYGIPAARFDELVSPEILDRIRRDASRALHSAAIALNDAPVDAPAETVNRVCGSGLQAVVHATEAIKVGYTDYDYSTAFSGWHISPGPAMPGQSWEDAYDLSKNPMLQYGFPATVKTTYASIEVKF